MCLAVPMRVKSVVGEMACCEIDGVEKEASLLMLDAVQPGDYLLIHAGFAIERLAPEQAEETLRLMRQALEETGPG